MDQARRTPRDEPNPQNPKHQNPVNNTPHERNPHRNTIKRIQNFDLYDGYT